MDKNNLYYGDNYEVSSATSWMRASISSTSTLQERQDYNARFVEQRARALPRSRPGHSLVTALAMLRPTSANPHLRDDQSKLRAELDVAHPL